MTRIPGAIGAIVGRQRPDAAATARPRQQRASKVKELI